MSITIREPRDRDFFAWLALYEGYAEFYAEPLTEERALTTWSWLTDPQHEENGLIALDEEERLVGLVNYRSFARPLEGDRGLWIDDLFVAPEARRRGVGSALIDAVKERAAKGGYSVVQWITAAGNDEARRLYDSVASATEWVTYELALS